MLSAGNRTKTHTKGMLRFRSSKKKEQETKPSKKEMTQERDCYGLRVEGSTIAAEK